jgi:cytidylate kinase
VPFAEVRDQIVDRDRLDTTRATAPLRAAADAITIDSTDLQALDVVAQMRARMAAARA